MIFKDLSYFYFFNFLQMKKLYFLFFLTIGFFGNAQIVNIPDANFKARLLAATSNNTIAKNLSGNYFRIDANYDGNIQISEALQVSLLNVYSCQISSLEGIQSFTNLKELNCYLNELTSLNVQGLTNLQNLNCYSNQISNINVQGLLNLQELNCFENQISTLDVQGLINLKHLNCNINQISTLDLHNLINIENLDCSSNQLTSLNIEGCNNLQIFTCSNNLLNSLDLSSFTNITTISCSSNQFVSINIKNGKLENWINFSNNSNLMYMCCDEEQIDYMQYLVSQYGMLNCSINSYCSFTPGGTFYEISGTTKFDSNSNGCDVSDINYSNLHFSVTDGTNTGSLIANQTGNYYIPVSAGNHTITPFLENPSYFNVLPTIFSVDFPTQISPFNQDFCVTANGVHSDVEIVLVPTTPARPGFDADYKLVYRNKGNQVENGTISLTFDDARLDYVAANPVYDSSVLNNFTWNYTNLQPFETREIEIVFNVNSPMETPAVNIGDQIDFLAQITPFTNDEVQSDNISALKQTVVGSYDPNDKTCLQGETIPPSEVGKYVHYVIRFENTGTFPAENIVVKDLIDLAKYDIATLVPLNSSHDFYTRINGNMVEFIFENINLDFNDATNDGYVAFKIKTLPSLVLGDTFTNNANIYFDYNFPITTNTYTTTVAALSTQDFDFGTYFTLYPNPANDVLNIQTKQDLQVNSIEIYNQLGQIVLAVTNAVNSIDVADLASGTYFVKVNTEKGSANSKFVKE